MEVGQGPNWGCSAKEKKYSLQLNQDPREIMPLYGEVTDWQHFGSQNKNTSFSNLL
jgi:hypothetical protein